MSLAKDLGEKLREFAGKGRDSAITYLASDGEIRVSTLSAVSYRLHIDEVSFPMRIDETARAISDNTITNYLIGIIPKKYRKREGFSLDKVASVVESAHYKRFPQDAPKDL